MLQEIWFGEVGNVFLAKDDTCFAGAENKAACQGFSANVASTPKPTPSAAARAGKRGGEGGGVEKIR